MFDNITLAMLGPVALYVFIGLVLRTFGPYLRVAYQLIKETNEWKLPKFDPKYILPPAATLGLYIVAVLTREGALLIMYQMHWTALILATYLGEDVIRRALRSLIGA